MQYSSPTSVKVNQGTLCNKNTKGLQKLSWILNLDYATFCDTTSMCIMKMEATM